MTEASESGSLRAVEWSNRLQEEETGIAFGLFHRRAFTRQQEP